MTEPTEVGSIVGYLILNRADWTAGVAATKKDADQLGRLSPNIRIQTNTGEVLGQLALVQAAERKVGSEADSASKKVGGPGIGLVGALLSVAPAAVPIGAVAGGALAGLLPVAATVALGVKGISDEMKAGALVGTQYGHDMGVLGNEAERLKNIAAGGLLTGIDKGLASAHGLLPEVNRDVAVMAGQIGDIVGDSGPGLLALLHGLSPLFATFGDEVESGAQHFEHWVTSSDDVQQFVAYVQAEMPEVVQFLGQLLTVVGHLTQASEGAGSGLVFGFTEVARAINSIPIGVLQVLIPLAISAKAAMLGYTAVTAVVNGVSIAWTAMGGVVAGVSEGVIASEVASQAVVDEAEAAKAAAALASARARMALVAGVSESLAAEAEADVASAEAIAEAEAAKAAETRAAATAMAESNAAAGASMSAVLGPIGAVVVGGALLATMFMHSGTSAQDSANEINNFASALEQSKGAIDANVRSTVAKSLADRGLLDIATAQGISLRDITSATLGNAAASDRVQASINAQAKAWTDLYNKGQLTHGQWEKMQTQLVDLAQGINHTSDQFGQASQRQKDLAAAAEQATTALGRQQAAAAALYGLTGSEGVATYQAAEQAAKKNTEQTRQQTLAFQLENNAAGLVNQALQTLAGQHLNNAQAQTALDQATLTLTQSLKHNGASIADNTTKGVANRQAIDGAVSALQGKLTAEAQATGSTEKATAQYRDNAKALLDQIGKLDGTKSAAYRYAQQLLKIPPIVKTKVDINADEIRAAIREVQALAASISSLPSATLNKVGQRSTIAGRASGGGLPQGLAWVGEAGPELVDKHGSNVQVYPHGASVAMAHAMGAPIPGYASGTPGAVVAAIMATLRPTATGVPKLSDVLGQHIAGASSRTDAAAAALAEYKALNLAAKAADHHANALANDAKQAQYAASQMATGTKAADAAKKAAESQARALTHQADAAKKVATAADNMATKGKAAYAKLAAAAKAATQVAAQDAQNLVAAITAQFQTLQQNVTGMESTISGSLTSGSDLATIYGQLGTNVQSTADALTQAQQALESAQQSVTQAIPDTSALAAAQQAEADAAQRQTAAHQALTAALAAGDPAGILAAQQAQTDAATNLAAAQAAVASSQQSLASQSGPTASQLQAVATAQANLTAAQQAYTAAKGADSASGVASVLSGFKGSESKFSGDLTHLKDLIGKGPAAQALITQLAGLGSQMGDALTEGLINDPASLHAILTSMQQIQSIADTEGGQLATSFYGSGIASMEQLISGIEAKFPEVVKALGPLAAQLSAMFTITMPDGSSVGGKAGKSAGLGFYLVNDIANGKWYGVNPGKKSVHELTAAQLAAYQAAGASVHTRTSGVPHFATGVTDFAGGLAMVHRDELLVNLPRGTDVIPANRSKGASAFGGGDSSAVVSEIRALRSQVAGLADEIGQVQVRVGAGLFDRAGIKQAERIMIATRGGRR